MVRAARDGLLKGEPGDILLLDAQRQRAHPPPQHSITLVNAHSAQQQIERQAMAPLLLL